jgi:phage gpG-like protein
MAVHKDFNSAFRALYRKISSVQSTLPNVLANEGTEFFVSNFELEGFTDVGFDAWTPRKTKSKKSKKKILVQSGRLRRAVNKSVTEKSFKRIVWQVNKSEVPYASVHNNGETINKGASSKVLYFRDTSTNIETRKVTGVFASNKKGTKKIFRATRGMKVNIGAHSIQMPRRHFMGKSEFLNKRFKLRIKEIYAKAFGK